MGCLQHASLQGCFPECKGLTLKVDIFLHFLETLSLKMVLYGLWSMRNKLVHFQGRRFGSLESKCALMLMILSGPGICCGMVLQQRRTSLLHKIVMYNLCRIHNQGRSKSLMVAASDRCVFLQQFLFIHFERKPWFSCDFRGQFCRSLLLRWWSWWVVGWGDVGWISCRFQWWRSRSQKHQHWQKLWSFIFALKPAQECMPLIMSLLYQQWR